MINALREIWDFSREERGNLNKSVLLGFVYAFFHMLQISAIYFVLLGLIEKDQSARPALIALAFLLVSILGRTVTDKVAQLERTHAGYFMVANKRISIGNKLKTVPMGYFNENHIGEITGITSSVLDEVENTAPMVLVNMMSGFINTLVFMPMVFLYQWQIGIFMAAGVILYLLVTSVMEKKSRALAPRRQRAQERLVDAVLEQLQGMQVIKAFNLTGEGDKKLRDALRNSQDANLNLERLFTPYTILQELVLRICSVGMVVFALYSYFTGGMDLLTALMSIIISFSAFSQLESAGSAMSILRVVSSSIEDANKTDALPQMDAEGKDLSPSSHDIVFRDVSFSYEKKKILENISFCLPDRSFTAVVGSSGSGKTTMCNLIARFWDVDRGQILIGGHNVKDYTLESLMRQISIVFQKVYLFEDTIENNIRFGRPDASRKEVIAAARKACCHDFIMSLPMGYETLVGEGGANLSGGEKQRISIARAVLKDAPVIILDEATANVDPENEDRLQSAIEALTKDKTVIMIAHRLKTVRHADQILVVDQRRIVQQGTHEELARQEGIYRRFIAEREGAAAWRLEEGG
nr:ABC transporter ATP-binding protein [Shuttleworthia satelles]